MVIIAADSAINELGIEYQEKLVIAEMFTRDGKNISLNYKFMFENIISRT